MSTASVFTSVRASDLLQTKHVQAYRGGLSAIPKTDKSADMESVCHAIVNTVANLYNVQNREDYAHYVKNIAPVLLSKVHGHVAKQEPILMVVLASQLSQHEGVRKFKPEDVLIRLDQLCKQISTIYRPGAKVDVVMDGLVHNGMFLSVSSTCYSYSNRSIRYRRRRRVGFHRCHARSCSQEILKHSQNSPNLELIAGRARRYPAASGRGQELFLTSCAVVERASHREIWQPQQQFRHDSSNIQGQICQ
jgi:hypothetical protein